MNRWVLLEERSPSGKTLYKCTECGRKSYTPDKWCGTTCGDQIEHVEFLQGECNHLLREYSDAKRETRELRTENDHLWKAHALLMQLHNVLEGVAIQSSELAGILDNVDEYLRSESLPEQEDER